MKLILVLMIIFDLSKTTALYDMSSQRIQEAASLPLNERLPLSSILASTSSPYCSVVMILDERQSSVSKEIIKGLNEDTAPRGISVLISYHTPGGQNSSVDEITNAITIARQLRRTSWCVTIVIQSENITLLTSFAKVSLEKRLFVWPTRLLLITRMGPTVIKTLMSDHWTFSMMNTMVINQDMIARIPSWRIYSYLPYTPEGPQLKTLGSWTEEKGWLLYGNHKFFPDKYIDFYGAIVNVTSLPWAPYWMEESYTKEDGTQGKIFFGSDGTMLHNIAASLNFTFYNVPCDSWKQVMEKLASRESFISPIRWTMLPERLAIFDMTYVYDYSFVGFCMAKPPLKPQWQSLQYPLTNSVWLSILASVVIVPLFLYSLTTFSGNRWSNEKFGLGKVVLEITGTLLGQNLSRALPKTDSSRVLMVFWLVFAFIIGTAFRGNLTAHLTLPKFPPRIEDVEELVKVADAVNGAPYNVEFKKFFLKSNDPVYSKLGELINPHMTVMEAMEQAVDNKRTAVIDIERYMGHIVADKFTKADGSTELYIGRSAILPGRAAWGIPHDAPFTRNLDWYIQASLESGLYSKWSLDVLERSRIESMRRQREHLKQWAKEDTEGIQALEDLSEESQSSNKALSLGHMQGPLFLLVIGLLVALLCFIAEKLHS